MSHRHASSHSRPSTWFRAAYGAALGQAHRYPYLTATAAAAVALGFAVLINERLAIERPSRMFLVAILITAATNGLWPALFASLISALFFDFFFLPPAFSFSINTAEGLTDFAFFIVTAVIVTTLAARVRRYAVEADSRALTAEKLSAFSRGLANTLTTQDVLDVAAREISVLTGRRIALIMMDNDCPGVRACHPPDGGPDSRDVDAAIAWWALGGAEFDDARFIAGGWRFRPMRGSKEASGLLASRPAKGPNMGGLDPADAGPAAATEAERLLNTLTHQTALAIERCALLARLESIRVRAETERLRAAVLSSISHDLRGPLAGIVGATSGLEHRWADLTDDARLALARSARREAGRLDAYIEKLLDITRIEAGVVVAKREPVQVREVVEAALAQASAALSGHRVLTVVPDHLRPADGDPLLLRQILHNLLENAAKYTPPGTTIELTAREDGDTIQIKVRDEGAGIPAGEIELIFEKYHRAPGSGAQAPGTGLGLAICRGFADAMGGRVEAGNRDDRVGAVFAVTLPAASQPVHREIETL